MSLRVVTSPKTEPVSLEIAKLHIPLITTRTIR